MARRLSFRPLFAAALLLALGFVGCGGGAPAPASATQSVKLRNRIFKLELALDDQTRHQGLSDRREIADDGGMLFVFAEPRELTFVMRRCYVPIDLIFLDPGGRIVQTHAMAVEPEGTEEKDLKRYSSGWPAQFAIEVKGGTLEKLPLKRGEKVLLPLKELKARAR